MQIGISGGRGFLGSALERALCKRGHVVLVTSRSDTNAVGWNPSQEPLPEKALWGTDALVHLAGEPLLGRWTAAKKKRLWDSRIKGTQNLVAGLRRLAEAGKPFPKILIAGSAIGFYGDTGDFPADETAVPGHGFLADLGFHWEEEARRASELGVRVVFARTGLVLDTHHGLLQRMLWPYKLGLGGRLGDGHQWMSWIHRDDWVGLVQWCLESDVEGPVNMVAPDAVRNREFSNTLSSILGRPAILPVPAWVLGLALGEMGGVALQSQRIIPRVAVQGGYRFAFPLLGGALADLL